MKSRFLSDEVTLAAVDKSTALKLNELIRKGVRGELPGQVISEEATKPVRETSPIEQLEKLNELRKTGAITEDEFQQLKARLLGVTPAPPSPPQPESCLFCRASSPVGKFCPVCGKKIRGLQKPLSA